MNMHRDNRAIIGAGNNDLSQYNFSKSVLAQKGKEYRIVPQIAEIQGVRRV